jgi:hypothetical protein
MRVVGSPSVSVIVLSRQGSSKYVKVCEHYTRYHHIVTLGFPPGPRRTVSFLFGASNGPPELVSARALRQVAKKRSWLFSIVSSSA